MASEDINGWLSSVLPAHERLTGNAEALVKSLIKNAEIDHLHVNGRTKSKAACLEKINRKNYDDPKAQLTDITGVRIVTYFESQVVEISNLIRSALEVDEEHSLDRAEILGKDRIGYRSVHFVCRLGKGRQSLEEYKDIAGLCFEIQIRTVLQHAWAELAHDRTYKFSGVLPAFLQRKLNLYAGMLEVVDQGFDEIARSVDEYAAKIHKVESLKGIEINSLSLAQYLERVMEQYGIELERMEIDAELIKELKGYGFLEIGQIDDLVTPAFIDIYSKHIKDDTYFGFIRDALMYNDIDRYFDVAWKAHWKACHRDTVDFLKSKYGQKAIDILKRKKISIID